MTNGKGTDSPRMQHLLKTYDSVFKDELSDGLPPTKPVDHGIEVSNDSRPYHRPLFQLSPAELKASKE